MARIKELKEKYPLMSLSLIDFLCELDPSKTNKFVPIFLKVSEDMVKRQLIEVIHEREYYIEYLRRFYPKKKKEDIKNLTNEELTHEYFKLQLVLKYLNEGTLETLYEFIDLFEKGLINEDLNRLNTIDDVNNLISLSHLSQLDNRDSENVKIEYRDDNWLLLRPLSHQSSLKYGANTRWCTSSKSDPYQFFKYSERGVLVYIINLNTGQKFGYFKEISNANHRELELSFWNQKDDRIDSLQCGFSNEVYEALRKIEDIPNKTFISDEYWKEQQLRFTKALEPMSDVEMVTELDEEDGYPEHELRQYPHPVLYEQHGMEPMQ